MAEPMHDSLVDGSLVDGSLVDGSLVDGSLVDGSLVDGSLVDHEYDGIREYDNPPPTWWSLIFLGTAVFSFLYLVFFHLGPLFGTNGWTLTQAYDASVAENLKRRFGEIGELHGDQATLLKYMQKPDWLAVGDGVFKTHCKSCHADDGRGKVGPNLTDDYYKNVKQLADLTKVIENGAANGSMPAWRNRLHPNEIVLVAAYVAKLRGKNLPGPRVQGDEEIPAWPSAGERGEHKPEEQRLESRTTGR